MMATFMQVHYPEPGGEHEKKHERISLKDAVD